MIDSVPPVTANEPTTWAAVLNVPVYVAELLPRENAHRLEDVDREDVHDLDEVQTIYGDIGPDPWTAYVLPILRELPRELLALVAGISERAINNLWHERNRPSPAVRTALTAFAADHARAAIGDDNADVNLDDETACMMAVISRPNRTQGEVPDGVIY